MVVKLQDRSCHDSQYGFCSSRPESHSHSHSHSHKTAGVGSLLNLPSFFSLALAMTQRKKRRFCTVLFSLLGNPVLNPSGLLITCRDLALAPLQGKKKRRGIQTSGGKKFESSCPTWKGPAAQCLNAAGDWNSNPTVACICRYAVLCGIVVLCTRERERAARQSLNQNLELFSFAVTEQKELSLPLRSETRQPIKGDSKCQTEHVPEGAQPPRCATALLEAWTPVAAGFSGSGVDVELFTAKRVQIFPSLPDPVTNHITA